MVRAVSLLAATCLGVGSTGVHAFYVPSLGGGGVWCRQHRTSSAGRTGAAAVRPLAAAAADSPTDYESYMAARQLKVEGDSAAPTLEAVEEAEVDAEDVTVEVMGREEPPPRPRPEDILSARVREEVGKVTARKQRMSELSSQLQRSMARKVEVEDLIAAELETVLEKLREEMAAEEERGVELRGLLSDFEEAIKDKQGVISEEQQLLVQMTTVRDQVKEESIKYQFADVMAKKADLISIEVILLEDMVDCREQLVQELEDTLAREKTISGVIEALPSLGDKASARAYNFEDIKALQGMLLENLESMAASDQTVANLRRKFDEALRQKKEVLGELRQENTVAEQSLFGGVSLDEARTMSDEDLKSLASDSASTAVKALGKSFKVSAASIGDFTKSEGGQELASSAVDFITGVKDAAAAVWTAFETANAAFRSNLMPGEEITTFDKLLKSTTQGITAVQKSPDVAKSVENVTERARAIPEAASALGKGTSAALEGVRQNQELMSSLSATIESLQRALVAVAGITGKSLQSMGGRYPALPPPPQMRSIEAEEDSKGQ